MGERHFIGVGRRGLRVGKSQPEDHKLGGLLGTLGIQQLQTALSLLVLWLAEQSAVGRPVLE